jgi:2-polyprenyl-3-methyl-5-hydroxy-6-metoxy-1,4-benzoquinol methylase
MTVDTARDLLDYVVQYRGLAFEPIQAAYRRRCVLSRIMQAAPKTLLEIGCGEAPLFTDLPGVDVTVIEPAGAFAAGARRLACGRDNIRVIESTLEQTSGIGTFDMVVISCVLHEVPDSAALLSAAARACSGSSVLHVNVPNANSLHRLLAVAMGLIDATNRTSLTQQRMQQRSIYDRCSLQAELEAAGFEIRDQGSLFVKPFSHAQMQTLVDQGFMSSQMLDGLDRLVEVLPELGSELWADARLRRG